MGPSSVMGTKEEHLSKAPLPQLHMVEAALLGLRGASHPFPPLGTDRVQGAWVGEQV